MKMYADCTSWQTCAGHIELDAMGVRGAIIIIQHVGWVRADGAVPVGRRKNGATPAINIAGVTVNESSLMDVFSLEERFCVMHMHIPSSPPPPPPLGP